MAGYICHIYSEKQKKVIDEAKKQLEKNSWYKGVCLDHVPKDDEIDKNFNYAVQKIISDTAYWDAE